MNLNLDDCLNESLKIINEISNKKQKTILETLSVKIKQSLQIQKSSTKLLSFYVHDLLSISQINNGKFRKDVTVFDLHDAVEEVMMIQ